MISDEIYSLLTISVSEVERVSVAIVSYLLLCELLASRCPGVALPLCALLRFVLVADFLHGHSAKYLRRDIAKPVRDKRGRTRRSGSRVRRARPHGGRGRVGRRGRGWLQLREFLRDALHLIRRRAADQIFERRAEFPGESVIRNRGLHCDVSLERGHLRTQRGIARVRGLRREGLWLSRRCGRGRGCTRGHKLWDEPFESLRQRRNCVVSLACVRSHRVPVAMTRCRDLRRRSRSGWSRRRTRRGRTRRSVDLVG